MKSIKRSLCTVALAGGALAFTSAGALAAPDNSYDANDLLMFFRNPAGTTGVNEVVMFSLGSTYNVFRAAATPNDPTFGTVISLGNINNMLTSTYGADWTSFSSSLYMGAVGQNGSINSASTAVSNGDYARTVYVTKRRDGAGVTGQAASAAAAVPLNNSGGVASAIQGGNSIAGNTNFVTSNPASLLNSDAQTLVNYNPFFNGSPTTAYTAIQGGVMGAISNASYTMTTVSGQSVTGVVGGLDLYRVTPSTNNVSAWQNINNIGVTAGTGYYLGTITLSENGDVNFAAVPEPSTYALLALAVAGLGAHVIRRRQKQS